MGEINDLGGICLSLFLGIATGDPAWRTGDSDVCICLFCGFQHYGTRLRCSGTFFWNLWIRDESITYDTVAIPEIHVKHEDEEK